MKQDIQMIRLAFVLAMLIVIIWTAEKAFRKVIHSPLATSDVASVSTPTQEFQTSYVDVIRIAGRNVKVSIADTPKSRERGLSGQAGLGRDEGMLFVFPEDGRHSFWMKDMRFPIDIVWLSADGRVITIAPDVSPDTYPRSFVPAAPARYVVELPAGFAETYNLKVGDIVRF